MKVHISLTKSPKHKIKKKGSSIIIYRSLFILVKENKR